MPSLTEQLNKWIQPLKNMILSMIGKAIIQAVDDSGKIQVVKILTNADEISNDVERLQEYGFTSNPPANSEAIIAAVGGDPTNIVVIASDNSTYRIKLEAGEVALYDKFGNYIKLKDGKIIVNSDSVLLGSDSADIKQVLGDTLKAYLDDMVNTIFIGWTPTPPPTGPLPADIGTLKLAMTAFVTKNALTNYLSDNHKIEANPVI